MLVESLVLASLPVALQKRRHQLRFLLPVRNPLGKLGDSWIGLALLKR